MTQKEIRAKLTSKILTSIEDNPPWRSVYNRGMPTNPKTNNQFTGINPLVLDVVADEKKYRSKYWATYKQWHILGQKVAKNSEGIPIVNWHPYYKPKAENNIVSMNRFHLLEQHIVYNAEQTFGKNTSQYLILKENKDVPEYAKVDEIIKAVGAIINHNNKFKKPIYERLPKDVINMPLRERFVDDAQYYASLFHELAHYSEWRVGWTGSIAQGELIAEIATGYLESELNLPHDKDLTNHKKWVKEWKENISANPIYLLEAAAQAAKTVDYILSFSRPVVLQEDENVVKLPRRNN